MTHPDAVQENPENDIAPIPIWNGDTHDDDGFVIDNLFAPQDMTPVIEHVGEVPELLTTKPTETLPHVPQRMICQSVAISQSDGTPFTTPVQILGVLPGRKNIIVSSLNGDVTFNGIETTSGAFMPSRQPFEISNYDGPLFATALPGASTTVYVNTMVIY